MFQFRNPKRDLIAIDSTRSVTHGSKRFIRNVLDGLIDYTDLRIILFSETDQFNSYGGKRVQISRVRMNKSYLIRTLNSIFFIPIRARCYRAALLYSPWDIGPIVKILPFVLGIHNPNSVTPRKHRGIKANLLHEFLSKMSARKAIFVEFPSRSAAKAIGNHMSIKEEKINVVYHGAEVLRWRNIVDRARLSGTKNKLGDYFIFWSWFFPTKNILTLIKAFSKFRNKNGMLKNIKLVCVGNFAYKKYKEEIVDLVESFGLNDQVIFIEKTSDAELVKLIYHSKAMVIPSLFETFGFMYVEGRVFNKPFIVADTEVAREVTEGQCIYFEGENPSDLAEKMILAVTGNDLSYNYKISDAFHEEHSARNLAEFFKKCLDSVVSE